MLSLESSHYASYAYEKGGFSVVEDDFGFITFKKLTDDTVYLYEVYLIPEKRGTTEGAEKIKEWEKVLNDYSILVGCRDIVASVDPESKLEKFNKEILAKSNFRPIGIQEYYLDFYKKKI